jgi:hypothetical protein
MAAQKARACWIILAVIVLIVVCFLLFPIEKVRDGEAYTYSASRLSQIGKALQVYMDVNHGKLPPAVVRNKEGKPLYSWRVLLLPFLEQRSLYERFDLKQPWDSPHNKPFSEKTPAPYLEWDSDEGGLTHYQVFVGPGTAFERDGLRQDDFPDGLAETILVVESGVGVRWSEPIDIQYRPEQAMPALGRFTRPVHFLGHEIKRQPGFNACFGDGAVRFIPNDTSKWLIRAFITRNGGENVSRSKLD